jgi:TolB-like protein/Flp pilus assembly protein TadD
VVPDPQPAAPRRARRWWIGAVILAIAVAGSAALWLRPHAGPAGPLSIAVLPFSSLGAGQDTEYFADGLTDELIDLLGRTEKLRVVARSSVFQYKNRTGDAREIARQLNADLILEGSVRKEGQRVRISAELVDARNGYQSWSETLEREGAQVFAVQREIATAIAAKLRVRPAGDRANRYAGNLEAYNLCLKGRYYWNKRTVQGFESAIAAFRQAIEKDPGYALAWAGLADSYTMLGFLHARAPLEVRQPATEAARRAVELDDMLAEAHIAQGNVQALFDWDWAGSEKSLRRAVQLDPNSALAHYGLSKLIASLGRLDEGLIEARRAQDLDPLSLIMAASTAWELAAARRYKESDAAYRAALELDPNFIWTYTLRAWSYEARGDYDKAISDLKRAVQLSGASTVAAGELAHALGRSGRKTEAAHILADLEARAKQQYVSSFDLSRAYEGLGRRAEAIAALGRACDELSPMAAFLKVEPLFDPMRSDPGFQAVLQRMHFE